MVNHGADFEPEPWGEDARLVELLGSQGAAEFRILLDGFPESVGLLWAVRDRSGRLVDFEFGYGNPAMLRGFRLPARTPDHYTLLEALPRMRGSRAFESYARVCDSGRPWVEEVSYDTPFGDGYMLGTYMQRIAKLGDGLVVFLTDVTAQRRMEAELRSYAGVVAHDLRDPITAITMLIALLERNPEQPPAPEVLRSLRVGAERARELIDGVLVYARSGELSIERLALTQLLAEIEAELGPVLERAGARLLVGDLPEVDGDRRQLRRVLDNLITNAIKFRGEREPVVEVEATRDRHEWVLTISDNGVGVRPEDASRIFGMFERGASAKGGDGIGLAVCRRIIDAHGGQIWVESREGGGSAFSFTLPR